MTRVKGQYLTIIAILAVVMAGCQAGPNKTGRVFMPDMYYSTAYNTYSANPNFADGMTARTPVAGTIARGMLPVAEYAADSFAHYSFLFQRYYENTQADYERAGAQLKNPMALSKETEAMGKTVYEINCMVCHGAQGDGDGTIVQTEAYPPVPKYSDRLPTINDGKMYHAITYGKNLMGSYSSHLSPVERWAVIYYIQKLAAVGPYSKEKANAAMEGNTDESVEGNNTVVEGDTSAAI